MTKRRGSGCKTLGDHVVPGKRQALERELLWAIALDGDRRRIEQLKRMLRPAANDPFDARVVVSPRQDLGAVGPPAGPLQPDH